MEFHVISKIFIKYQPSDKMTTQPAREAPDIKTK